MKRIQFFLIIFVILIALTSCATFYAKQVDDMMKTWLNASKDQLLLQWGPPSETFRDGKGGEIWTYTFTNQTTGYAYTDSYGHTYWRSPQQYQVVRQFFINEDGIIYAYRWQGI